MLFTVRNINGVSGVVGISIGIEGWHNTAVLSISEKDQYTKICQGSRTLFYQDATPAWSDAKMRPLMRYLVQIHQHRHGNLGGRTRVSTEGWNATFTALDLPHASITAAATLQHVAQDLRQFIPVVFFRIPISNTWIIKELVYFGLDETVAPRVNNFTSIWLAPPQAATTMTKKRS